MKTKESKNGNLMENFNIPASMLNFAAYPQIQIEINDSLSAESSYLHIYVKYVNTENQKAITCRFTQHGDNEVRLAYQLSGLAATENEILFHLGLKRKVFVPETYLSIWKESVAKKKLAQYEESDLTISEMYDLGEGADLSAYKGKLAKGSNYLILGDKIELTNRVVRDITGVIVNVGNYIYQ